MRTGRGQGLFNAALDDDPFHTQTLVRYGVLLMAEGRLEEAHALIQRAVMVEDNEAGVAMRALRAVEARSSWKHSLSKMRVVAGLGENMTPEAAHEKLQEAKVRLGEAYKAYKTAETEEATARAKERVVVAKGMVMQWQQHLALAEQEAKEREEAGEQQAQEQTLEGAEADAKSGGEDEKLERWEAESGAADAGPVGVGDTVEGPVVPEPISTQSAATVVSPQSPGSPGINCPSCGTPGCRRFCRECGRRNPFWEGAESPTLLREKDAAAVAPQTNAGDLGETGTGEGDVHSAGEQIVVDTDGPHQVHHFIAAQAGPIDAEKGEDQGMQVSQVEPAVIVLEPEQRPSDEPPADQLKASAEVAENQPLDIAPGQEPELALPASLELLQAELTRIREEARAARAFAERVQTEHQVEVEQLREQVRRSRHEVNTIRKAITAVQTRPPSRKSERPPSRKSESVQVPPSAGATGQNCQHPSQMVACIFSWLDVARSGRLGEVEVMTLALIDGNPSCDPEECFSMIVQLVDGDREQGISLSELQRLYLSPECRTALLENGLSFAPAAHYAHLLEEYSSGNREFYRKLSGIIDAIGAYRVPSRDGRYTKWHHGPKRRILLGAMECDWSDGG